jgi:hypothetical protein
MKLHNLNVILIAGVFVSMPLQADTNKVQLPENFRSSFVRYTSIDKPNAENPQKTKMRYFYVNPDSLVAAKPGQALPDGTILIMEDHGIELDDYGQAKLDSAGRFIATDEIRNIFVQEKQPGWGAQYAPEKRNGEWEYAWFRADGSRKLDANLDGCFNCHKSVAAMDYNFTFSPFVATIKN